MSFNTPPNYFCAKAYATPEAAQAGSCSSGWDTLRPLGTGNAPYYVALVASTKKISVGLISNYLPNIKRSDVIKVGSPPPTVPTCTGAGKALQYNGTSYSCRDLVPSCPDPNMVLKSNASGALYCSYSSFGGTFTTGAARNSAGYCTPNPEAQCRIGNPFAGNGCSCPSGFYPVETWNFVSAYQSIYYGDGCPNHPTYAVRGYHCISR